MWTHAKSWQKCRSHRHSGASHWRIMIRFQTTMWTFQRRTTHIGFNSRVPWYKDGGCHFGNWTHTYALGTRFLHIVKDVGMWSIISSIYPSDHPCELTSWKLQGCRLHTIPLLSLTLHLSTHQEWEGNLSIMQCSPS